MALSRFRIILIEPEYEMNLGAAARLMRNFGQSPLYLVKPNCIIGFTAKMHAKHATDILEKAVICDTLEEALKGCSQVVGTSGVLNRHRHALRHPLTLEQFRSQLGGQKLARQGKGQKSAQQPIAILFGREGIGLLESEIERCDVLITIPTQKRYPVMNLSHAMAVVLYALCAQEKKPKSVGLAPTAGEKKQLLLTFEALTNRYAHNLRHPDKAKLAFKRIAARAAPDQIETLSVLTVLRQALRELNGEKVWMPPSKTGKEKKN